MYICKKYTEDLLWSIFYNFEQTIMKTKTLLIAMLATGCVAVADAQIYDISDGYLFNNSFDEKCAILVGEEGNIEPVDHVVPFGWELYNPTLSRKGVMTTVEKGTSATICGVPVPAVGYDETDTEGGFAAFYISSTAKYTLLQSLVLPPGNYKIVAATRNTSSQTSIVSMMKWRPKIGAVSSTLRTFPENEWVTDTVSFTLTDTTSGDLWAGYSSNKTAGTVLFLDWVRLYRDTPLGEADVKIKKEKLSELMATATEELGDAQGDAADVLRSVIAEAKVLADASDASTQSLKNMIAELTKAIGDFQWLRDIVITTDKGYARGSTMAFGRMTVSGVDASLIAEQGFAFSKTENPTVDDEVNEETLSNNGTIYWKKNLEPATKYYVRPFVKSANGNVAYGKQTILYTLPKGQISYEVRSGGTDEQYNRIKNATVEAVDYWNNLTSIKGVRISSGFVDGVPTADCSYGGWIRVGSNASYQATGTILHEMLHGVGVIPWASTQWSKSNLRTSEGTGQWTGDRVTEVIRFWDNNTNGVLNGDTQHMWPYGINGAHEDNHTKELYIGNSLVIQALAEDGLETSYTYHGAPYYSKEIEDGVKYYIKSEADNCGRTTSYLMPQKSGVLKIVNMSAADAVNNDSVAWYINFNPVNQYYQFTNVATGERLAYNSSAFRTSTQTSAAYDMQLMKGRLNVTEHNLRGYWIIHPETNNWSPSSMTANVNGSVSATGLDLANSGNGLVQRWLILSEEELPFVDSETLGVDASVMKQDTEVEHAGVYSINGTRIRLHNSVEGLPKGLYIVGGKKVVVK